jgi:hypothetical protein
MDRQADRRCLVLTQGLLFDRQEARGKEQQIYYFSLEA